MTLINQERIKTYQKKSTIHLTIEIAVFLIFLGLAILMVCLASQETSVLYQVLAIIFSSLGGMFFIFDYFVYYQYYHSIKKIMSSLLLTDKKEEKGIILDVGEEKTISKNIKGKPITIKTSERNEVYYWLDFYGPFNYKVGDFFYFKYSDNIICEVKDER